ncbi:hypothetical protein [Amycolatopsis sp. lyj-112]|uniref:hypothetical protein n=1 Tax=Amycolatopsis sp. lyj-112 TaxID=2789288 RepID=UPI00397CB723
MRLAADGHDVAVNDIPLNEAELEAVAKDGMGEVRNHRERVLSGNRRDRDVGPPTRNWRNRKGSGRGRPSRSTPT